MTMLPTKAALIALLNLAIIRWFLSKNKAQEQIHDPNWILCKAADLDLDQQPVWGKGVCSDFNWTAQQLQMTMHKCLKILFGMILNWSQPKFTAKSIANEMQFLKAMYQFSI